MASETENPPCSSPGLASAGELRIKELELQLEHQRQIFGRCRVETQEAEHYWIPILQKDRPSKGSPFKRIDPIFSRFSQSQPHIQASKATRPFLAIASFFVSYARRSSCGMARMLLV
jgi:hypothetical protein